MGIEQPSFNRDFLKESINYRFSFTEEAVRHLPEITQEDIESGKECFALMLGTWSGDQNDISLNVSSVLRVPDDSRFYKETEGGVDDINYKAIRQLIEQFKQLGHIDKGLVLLGDVHTHPITDEELEHLDGQQAAFSEGDQISAISHYLEGDLDSSSPYIFGVISDTLNREQDDRSTYTFFRVAQDDEGNYKCIQI